MVAKTFPASARVGAVTLNVDAHSRKGASLGGHYSFERGPGAHWAGSLEILPNTTPSALKFRAFLHSLRGRSGTFNLILPGVVLPSGAPLPSFTDGSDFSDGTKFSDLLGVTSSTFDSTITALAPKDTDSLTAAAGFTSSPLCVLGGYMTIGVLGSTHQLLRIVGISGNVLKVRPRLRSAFASGSVIKAGRVTAEFRLADKTPSVPLVGNTARGFSLDIEENY